MKHQIRDLNNLLYLWVSAFGWPTGQRCDLFCRFIGMKLVSEKNKQAAQLYKPQGSSLGTKLAAYTLEIMELKKNKTHLQEITLI